MHAAPLPFGGCVISDYAPLHLCRNQTLLTSLCARNSPLWRLGSSQPATEAFLVVFVVVLHVFQLHFSPFLSLSPPSCVLVSCQTSHSFSTSLVLYLANSLFQTMFIFQRRASQPGEDDPSTVETTGSSTSITPSMNDTDDNTGLGGYVGLALSEHLVFVPAKANQVPSDTYAP